MSTLLLLAFGLAALAGCAPATDADETGVPASAAEVAALVDAVAAQAARVDALEATVAAQASEIAALEARVVELEDLALTAGDLAALGYVDEATLQATLDEQLGDLPLLVPYLSVDPSTWTVALSGLNLYVQSGSGATDATPNGRGNLILGYPGEGTSLRTGSHNLVLGYGNSFTSYGGLVGGEGNLIGGPYAMVLAGADNRASGDGAVVIAGSENLASGQASVVVAGSLNDATGKYSGMLAGETNVASGSRAAVVAGYDVVASGNGAALLAGVSATAGGHNAGVVGGCGTTEPDYCGTAP